jgi:VanZ family protein
MIDSIHSLIRKAAHATEYAILALLWFHSLGRGTYLGAPGSAWLALVISVGCAIVDESHQATLPDRTGSFRDVLLDSFGAAAALAPAWFGSWRVTAVTTGVLLGIALVGGMSALAFNLAAGANDGVMWYPVSGVTVVMLLYWQGTRSSS